MMYNITITAFFEFGETFDAAQMSAKEKAENLHEKKKIDKFSISGGNLCFV